MIGSGLKTLSEGFSVLIKHMGQLVHRLTVADESDEYTKGKAFRAIVGRSHNTDMIQGATNTRDTFTRVKFYTRYADIKENGYIGVGKSVYQVESIENNLDQGVDVVVYYARLVDKWGGR